MRLGTETGSVVNHLMSRGVVGQPEPQVGMGCTLLSWTDRAGATVVAWDGRTLVVQEDSARRTDSNGMSEQQVYEHTPNAEAPRLSYRKDRKGMWRACDLNEKGRMVFTGGRGLQLGHRSTYHDFSF